jgi:hypothetical protein
MRKHASPGINEKSRYTSPAQEKISAARMKMLKFLRALKRYIVIRTGIIKPLSTRPGRNER